MEAKPAQQSTAREKRTITLDPTLKQPPTSPSAFNGLFPISSQDGILMICACAVMEKMAHARRQPVKTPHPELNCTKPGNCKSGTKQASELCDPRWVLRPMASRQESHHQIRRLVVLAVTIHICSTPPAREPWTRPNVHQELGGIEEWETENRIAIASLAAENFQGKIKDLPAFCHIPLHFSMFTVAQCYNAPAPNPFARPTQATVAKLSF